MPDAMMRNALLLVALAALLAMPTGCHRKEPAPFSPARVAAAADLAFAFEEVGAAFAKKTGTKPIFSFGSTGLLAKQIEEGAPFDVFAAANVSFAERVIAAGTCDASTKALYARGRIVLWGRAGVVLPDTLAGLADSRFVKIALANPEHAPYGHAAREAMENAGVWETVKGRAVYGENVQQTLQFAQTGNADVAFVALSLATVTKDGSYVSIDESLHAPIDQALVVCRHGKNPEMGKAFTEFVSSPEGHAIMKRYGFLLPGEVLAQAH